MSELDAKLAELRDDLEAAITPPDLAHVTGRARQRSVRRRMQVGAVAVVVASVAVPVLRTLPDAQRPAITVPASMTFDVDFADADHGYALGSDCEDPDGGCVIALFASADGGRTWEARELPDGRERYSSGSLTVLDADHVAVGRTTHPDKLATRTVSTDGGRTWEDRMQGGAAAPAPLRDGAWLQRVCLAEEETDGGCRIGVGTASLDSDQVVPAPAQPPLVEPVLGRSATEGGRFWAVGVDRGNGRWTIAVSDDGGRTWMTTPVAVPGEPSMNDAWAVVEADGVMYATLQGSIAKGPFGLLAVFRSTNGGETWTNTFRATPDTVLQAMLGSPVATSDGRLLVHSATTGTYESADGTTFTKARHQLPGEVEWTRAGYVVKRAAHEYAVSTDGIEWRDFRIG